MTQVCCDRCDQLMTYDPAEHFYADAVCARCRAAEREAQGEAVRLFTPAPAQMPGQAAMCSCGGATVCGFCENGCGLV